jgi:hypothetical protein
MFVKGLYLSKSSIMVLFLKILISTEYEPHQKKLGDNHKNPNSLLPSRKESKKLGVILLYTLSK